MTDFVTETGRYNEVSFNGSIDMSLKKGAKEALNGLAVDTYDHDLPEFCFATGLYTGTGWIWEVKTYMRQITICKTPTKEDVEEVASAINTAYNNWRDIYQEEERTRKIDDMIDRCWH
jgi:hypothetical protein